MFDPFVVRRGVVSPYAGGAYLLMKGEYV